MEAGGGGKLKLYADFNSPFARAVILFCRVNGIEHEYIRIDCVKRETRTPEFAKINPMQRIPFIDDDGFKLRESVTIMRYLATTRNVPDHWYPRDPKRRAVIDSVLDWIPLNITSNWSNLLELRVFAKIPEVAKMLQLESDEKLEAKYETNLKDSLDLVETVFLRGPGKFLENGEEVSLADIVLVCQLKQLLFLDPETQKVLLGSRENIEAWMVAVENSTNPHFEEAHESTYATARQFQAGRDMAEKFSS